VRSSASSFSFRYPVSSLRSSSSCLRLLPCLPVIFPSITCFRRQFLLKMWPIYSAFLLFVVCRIVLSSWLLVLFVILLHFPHDWPNWSSPSFSITTFQSFPFISDLLSEASNIQYHTKLYCTYSIVLVSSLKLSPVCWWKNLPLVESRFCHGNPARLRV